MLEYSRNCVLDLCDLDGNKVCPIYDSSVEIQQFAKDVFKATERNGWKTITFTLSSPDRDVENFITTYIKPEYKIRLIDDDGTDWFILDKPKITHSNYAKTYSITAEHCSAILKYRRLDLEFSTEKLNNVGTCEQLLTTILEGTGWTVGTVSEFREKYEPHDIKKRTMKAASKTGAFNLISKMCDLFEAKPVYNGYTKVVDILPINPFDDTSIDPTTGLPDLSKAKNIYEIYYGINMKTMSKSQDSSNVVTKLNVYGSYGDTTKGYCGITNLTHNEYRFDVTAAGNYYIEITNPFDSTKKYVNFTTDKAASDLVFSNLDRTSMSYVYDYANDCIYKTSLSITPVGTQITPTSSNVKNWVPFITDFTYYIETGLLTDTQLYDIAVYQNSVPEIMEKTYEANIQFTNDWSTYTNYVGGTDFVKLDVQTCVKEGDNYVIYLNEDEIIYRTDYYEIKQNYFNWKISNGLKTNGDSINSEASLIYIIHSSNDTSKSYERTYIKAISDVAGSGRKLVLWSDIQNFPSNDQYYLFQSSSVNGTLGGVEVTEMAVVDAANAYPKGDTVKHPVFWGALDASKISEFTEYAWFVNTNANSTPTIYFCYKQLGDSTWLLSYIGTTEPSASTYYYWYNPNEAKVYYAVDGSWRLLYDKNAPADAERTRRKKIFEKFSQVQLYIDQYEECWKGKYEQYNYTCPTLPAGNYYYADPYNNGYLFTTNIAMTTDDKLMLNTTTGWVTPTHYSGSSVDILSGATWTPGTIDTAGNIYTAYTTEITNAINVSDNMIYNCVGSNFVLTWYNSSGLFVKQDKLDTNKTIASPANAAILRVTRQNSAAISMTTNGTNYDALQTEVIKLYNSAVTYHSSNILDGVSWESGKINASGGDIDDDTKQRTTWINAYENTQYHLTEGATVDMFFYSSKSIFISSTTLNSGSTITTPAQTKYIRFVKAKDTTVKVQVVDYDKYIIYSDKQYKILTPWIGYGELNGLYNLIKKFNTYADATYITDRETINTYNQLRADLEDDLVDSLGEIYKENTWQDANYVEGDEKKLFFDAIEKLDDAAKPKTTYEIGFLDLYRSDIDEYVQWPDIDINSALHIVDEQMEENRWAFVDKLNKCYDCPWKTTISVNTDLTTVSNKSFSDVMSEIADVGSAVKASDGIVDAVSDITSGKELIASKISGALDISKASIDGAASSWHTDEKGNIIFESALGTSAMKLCGDGLAIANKKDEFGDWEWTTFGTGDGFTADLINAGTIRGNLIEAGSLTTDKVTSTFGNELEIGSNRSLIMFATVDGTRPAGAVNVTKAGESWISIDKDNGIVLNTGANIDLVAGNTITMNGADVNISANSTIDMASSDITIDANSTFKATGGQTGSELVIDENGVTVTGNTIKLLNTTERNGTIMLGDEKNTITASGILSLNNGSLVLDGSSTGNGKITTTGDIEITGGTGNLNLTNAADINVDSNSKVNISGGELNLTSSGAFNVESGTVAIKADGAMSIATGGTLTIDTGNFAVKEDGSVMFDGELYATRGRIGGSREQTNTGWIIEENKIYSGDINGDNYIELNSDPNAAWAIKVGGSGDPDGNDVYDTTTETIVPAEWINTSENNWEATVDLSKYPDTTFASTVTLTPDIGGTVTLDTAVKSKTATIKVTGATGTPVSGLTSARIVYKGKREGTFKRPDFAVNRLGVTVIGSLRRYTSQSSGTLETIDLRSSLWKMDSAYSTANTNATYNPNKLEVVQVTEDTVKIVLTCGSTGQHVFETNPFSTAGALKQLVGYKFHDPVTTATGITFSVSGVKQDGTIINDTTKSGSELQLSLVYHSSGTYAGQVGAKGFLTSNSGASISGTVYKPLTLGRDVEKEGTDTIVVTPNALLDTTTITGADYTKAKIKAGIKEFQTGILLGVVGTATYGAIVAESAESVYRSVPSITKTSNTIYNLISVIQNSDGTEKQRTELTKTISVIADKTTGAAGSGTITITPKATLEGLTFEGTAKDAVASLREDLGQGAITVYPQVTYNGSTISLTGTTYTAGDKVGYTSGKLVTYGTINDRLITSAGTQRTVNTIIVPSTGTGKLTLTPTTTIEGVSTSFTGDSKDITIAYQAGTTTSVIHNTTYDGSTLIDTATLSIDNPIVSVANNKITITARVSNSSTLAEDTYDIPFGGASMSVSGTSIIANASVNGTTFSNLDSVSSSWTINNISNGIINATMNLTKGGSSFKSITGSYDVKSLLITVPVSTKKIINTASVKYGINGYIAADSYVIKKGMVGSSSSRASISKLYKGINPMSVVVTSTQGKQYSGTSSIIYPASTSAVASSVNICNTEYNFGSAYNIDGQKSVSYHQYYFSSGLSPRKFVSGDLGKYAYMGYSTTYRLHAYSYYLDSRVSGAQYMVYKHDAGSLLHLFYTSETSGYTKKTSVGTTALSSGTAYSEYEEKSAYPYDTYYTAGTVEVKTLSPEPSGNVVYRVNSTTNNIAEVTSVTDYYYNGTSYKYIDNDTATKVYEPQTVNILNSTAAVGSTAYYEKSDVLDNITDGYVTLYKKE